MPTIAQIRRDFDATLAGARALFNFSLTVQGIHSDAGVEAAFLQMFKGWEGLLEEAVIAYMCRRIARDGQSVCCHVLAPNDGVARAVLYQNRPYIEWTNPDEVRERARCYFTLPNRIDAALSPVMGELRQTATIRNAIAHSSPISREKLEELAQKKFGGKPTISRPAHFLLKNDPVASKQTLFDTYAAAIETAAIKITG